MPYQSIDINQATRLEQKIDALQETITQLMIINQEHKSASLQNTEAILALKTKVDDIDKNIDLLNIKESRLEGGIRSFKWISATFSGFLFVALSASSGWLFNSTLENKSLSEKAIHNNSELDRKIAELNQDIKDLESRWPR